MHIEKPQISHGYWIGEAAKRSGVTVASIRHYEQTGLIQRRSGSESGYRWYEQEDIHQLRFIRQLRGLDMSLAEVRTLLQLDLGKRQDCQTARNTLDQHIAGVGDRIAELQSLQAKLKSLRGQCDGSADRCQLLGSLHALADGKESIPSP
jgi:DNA-binding transcriptional MerR regulator